MKKRTAFILLTLALLLCLCPVVAAGTGGDDELPEIPIDGNTQKCGDDLYWSFRATTGVLAITGSGAMDDYASLDDQPWAAVRDQIKKISLPERLQDIGTWAFSGCRGLTSITIPHGVTHIYGNAFRDCDVLTEVQYDGTKRQQESISISNTNVSLLNAVWHYWEPVSIALNRLPQTTWPEGQAFSADGGELQVYYGVKSGADYYETEPLTIALVSGYDPAVVGKQTLTVTFGGKTTSFEVTVDHVPGEPVQENVVAATTEAGGSYDEVVYCTVCHAELSRVHRTTDKLPTVFTGIVTYRSGKEVYLQEGDRGLVALLDNGNAQADLDTVQVGKRVTMSGEALTMNRSGYHIPEIMDAMIVEVQDTEATVSPAAATIDQLNDGLMIRLVRVKDTKKALTAANLQLNLDKYQEEQVLTVTGVLSADTKGRVLLGASIRAEHVPKEPVKENEVAPTCTEAGSYDEVTYCAVCHKELSRVRKTAPALGHAPGDPVKENEVPATTTAEGSYDEVVYCTRCHAELSREHRIAEKLPAPPTIKTQPKNARVKSGSKAKFAMQVKEKNVTYQWLCMAPGAADWTELQGETKATMTVVGTKTNNGTQYRCRLRNTAGGEVYSNIVTLTVKIQPPVVKTQPKDLTAKSGKKAKFSVKASGKGLIYTWYSRPNAEGEWTAVAGQAKKNLTIIASRANNGSQYYCRIQNADGEVDTNVVTLTVTPQPPTVKTQPKDAAVKLGAKAKFKVKATGKNVTYQWYYRTSETGEWILIDGATKATYEIVATEANIGWQFRCLAKNDDGQAYSDPATLFKK